MERPKGFVAQGKENKVCKLVNILHGLKQAPKQCLSSIIRSTICLADVILGIKITRTQNGLVLRQTHDVDKILEKFNQGDTSIARTPTDTSQHLSKIVEIMLHVEYSRIIGSLMYLMSCTRPNLAYAINRLSRYTNTQESMDCIMEDIHLDANRISDIKDSRSTSGYVLTLRGAAISWKSSKQTMRSTMESKFIALDKSGEKPEWMCQFAEDVRKWPKPVTAIGIHCDSQLAIGRAQSTMYNGKSRHIRCMHNTIRQLLSTGVISIDYVKSKDNIMDPLTKGLSRDLFYKSSKVMGLNPLNE
ncbi:hypothetical protein OSB04_011490 [Centaurea solstitialis]|uniref:Uncharacterized protein n=1 Tax=Centaurea solstitialis TaxID=347529 RepID=A0AA38TMN2_9ASTR|nr:hypothetical protein OSB04_011490 [Centaurea solstitialis]